MLFLSSPNPRQSLLQLFFLSIFFTALSVKPKKKKKTMELFLEFLSTLALSLLLAFLGAKILSGSSSSSTCGDHHEGSGMVVGARKFEAKSEEHGFGGERGTGFEFVKEIVVGDGDLGESRKERFVLEETLNEDDVEIYENEGSREVEVAGMVEKVVEEKMVIQSIGSEKNVDFEMGLCKDGILVRENETEEDDYGKSGIFGCEEISVESGNIAKNETECCEDEMVVAKSGEIEILECECDNKVGEGNMNGKYVVKKVPFEEDDDWEGIERTELERLFGAAVAFVGSKSNAERISSLGSNLMKQLYGLHKIATEGPCHEPQPMALKVSARANWNAWKQFGNMAPEVAMEQYVTILLESIPGCTQDDIVGDASADAYSKLASDLKTWQQRNQLGAVDERNIDKLMPPFEAFDVIGSLDPDTLSKETSLQFYAKCYSSTK